MVKADVVLMAPPYFRFCGSHNDRICPTLSYLAAYLDQAGISYVIYNADATGADRFWSMRWLFNNFSSFIDAVDGKGSLYGEVVEVVMSFSPSIVVLTGSEPLIATKDWSNPFITANFARMLRWLGVFTVGIGHFFTLDRARFADSFDCIMGGEPSRAIVDIVRRRRTGYVEPQPIDLDVVPRLAPAFPLGQRADFIMTSFGCRFPCSFCLAQQLYSALNQPVRFVELDTVVQDVAQRAEEEIYLTDLTFTMSPNRRLRALAQSLRQAGIHKRFTIDTRADCITEENADILAELGVVRVKIGVEGAKPAMLEAFNKRTTVDANERAIGILRARGIGVLTYLLIGGDVSEADYAATRDYIHKLKPDFVPVAIWAYDLAGDYRYDTQFSPVTLQRWGISEDIFFKYLELQEAQNPTVGSLLDMP